MSISADAACAAAGDRLKIGAAAKQHGIQMSVHAPYFINLVRGERAHGENVGYVLETARLAEPLGATRMVVHCGGQGKLTRDRAMRNSHENVKTSCVRWMRLT